MTTQTSKPMSPVDAAAAAASPRKSGPSHDDASKQRTEAERADRAPGEETVDSPKLPHERDQSTGMTDGAPSEDIQQAHRDLERGLQDTGRAPETDRTYEKLKR
jgi:hypothetical protein